MSSILSRTVIRAELYSPKSSPQSQGQIKTRMETIHITSLTFTLSSFLGRLLYENNKQVYKPLSFFTLYVFFVF